MARRAPATYMPTSVGLLAAPDEVDDAALAEPEEEEAAELVPVRDAELVRDALEPDALEADEEADAEADEREDETEAAEGKMLETVPERTVVLAEGVDETTAKTVVLVDDDEPSVRTVVLVEEDVTGTTEVLAEEDIPEAGIWLAMVGGSSSKKGEITYQTMRYWQEQCRQRGQK